MVCYLSCCALCLCSITSDSGARNCKCSICNSPITYHNSCYQTIDAPLACRTCSPLQEVNFHSPTDDNDPMTDIDPDSNFHSFRSSTCQYFDVSKFNNHFQALPENRISFIHVNSRSLESNFTSLYSDYAYFKIFL